METKSTISFSSIPYVFWVNLYGMETVFYNLFSVMHERVLSEPVWDGNETFTKNNHKAFMFWVNLYGMETQVQACMNS